MNVVHCLHTQIGEQHFASRGQIREHLRIEIAGWIERGPARSDEMARVQHGCRERRVASLIQKEMLDGRFTAAVIAEGFARRVLCRGNLDAVTMRSEEQTSELQSHSF